MKRILTTLVALLALTVGTAATQVEQVVPQTRQNATLPEVVLTGCVIQGSSSTIFLLDNAKKDPNSANEKGVRYILASTVEDVDLRTHLNHEVRIVGEVDLKVSAMPVIEPTKPTDPKRPAPELTLPRLNAKSVTMVADTCGVVR